MHCIAELKLTHPGSLRVSFALEPKGADSEQVLGCCQEVFEHTKTMQLLSDVKRISISSLPWKLGNDVP